MILSFYGFNHEFHDLFREDSCIFIVLREKALKEQSFHETDFLDMWKTDNFAV